MVEPQSSKLITRVRFPSPAPSCTASHLAQRRRRKYGASCGASNARTTSSRSSPTTCGVPCSRCFARYPLAERGELRRAGPGIADADDYQRVEQDDVLVLDGVRAALKDGTDLTARNTTRDEEYAVHHRLAGQQVRHAAGRRPRSVAPRAGRRTGSVSRAQPPRGTSRSSARRSTTVEYLSPSAQPSG